MAKRKRNNNILRRLKEGRGIGKGSDYSPWITIHDVASDGRSQRHFDEKNQRIIHTLSDNESVYSLILEFSPMVKDYREQYPLELEATKRIADELGIKHPQYNGDLVVMTTDFVITLTDDSLLARTLKVKKDIENKNVIEHFEIERKYWEEKGVNWKINVKEDVSPVLRSNLEKCSGFNNRGKIEALKNYNDDELAELYTELQSRLLNEAKILSDIVGEFDADAGLPPNTSIRMVYLMIWTGIIKVDLLKPINVHNRLEVQSITELYLNELEEIN